MNTKKTFHKKYYFCNCLLIFFIMVSGCAESGPKVEEFLIGSCRTYKMKVHSILTFHANGNWVIENRVEGKLSKIVSKKGRITGEWFYTDDIEGLMPEGYELPEELENFADKNGTEEGAEGGANIFLVLSVLKAEETEYWLEGSTNPFHLVVLDKDQLVMQDFKGKKMSWDRVRGAERGKNISSDGTIAISLGSMVVNLSRTKIRHRRRYLCVDLDIFIEVPVQEGVSLPEPPPLHPRVREAAIFYLSSLTYKELKSIDKVQDHIKKLQAVLNPYLKGKISNLHIKNIIVSTEKRVVDDFRNQILKPQEVEEIPAEGEGQEKTEEEEVAEG